MKNIYLIICGVTIMSLISWTSPNVSKVLGMPKEFNRPKASGADEISGNYFNTILPKSKNDPWLVYADQPIPTMNIEFRDWFYVVDERTTEVLLAKAELRSGLRIENGSYEQIGWVDKRKLLLWSRGLVNRKSIDQKVLLLNTIASANNLIKNGAKSKNKVNIYNSPTGFDKINSNNIYEYFFVLKKKNNRYLIARNISFGRGNTEQIIGWVAQNRATEWNTRITLEPNFENTAFNERKSKEIYSMGFSSIEKSDSYASSGKYNKSEVLWDSDPAKLNTSYLASDKKRFKGSVIRFPVLAKNAASYRTGIIQKVTIASIGRKLGEVGTIEYSDLQEKIKNSRDKRGQFNIMFLMDGTSKMGGYKNELRNLLETLNVSGRDNVRYGAAVYRDYILAKNDDRFKIEPLTKNKNTIINFLDEVKTFDGTNNDKEESVMYGIDQMLLQGGFKKGQTNILIILGDAGDVRHNNFRAQDASMYNENDMQKLIERIAGVELHMFSIQCGTDGSSAYRNFNFDNRHLILEASKLQYNKYRGLKLFTSTGLKSPEVIKDGSDYDYSLINGTTRGKVFTSSNGYISPSLLPKYINESIEEVNVFVEDLDKKLSKIFESGQSYDDAMAGDAGPAIIDALSKQLKNNNDEITKVAQEKYQFQLDAYVPHTIAGTNHPAFSYVLFMPQEDLKNLVASLDGLADAEGGAMDTRRAKLKETWLEILRNFLGDDKKNNYEDKNFEEIEKMLQGLEGENIDLNKDKLLGKVKLRDITNENKVSNDDIRQYIKETLEKYKTLQRIYQDANYEFSYKSGDNIYYWIPVEYLP